MIKKGYYYKRLSDILNVYNSPPRSSRVVVAGENVNPVTPVIRLGRIFILVLSGTGTMDLSGM